MRTTPISRSPGSYRKSYLQQPPISVAYTRVSYHHIFSILDRWEVVSLAFRINMAIYPTLSLPNEVVIDPNHAYIPPRQPLCM